MYVCSQFNVKVDPLLGRNPFSVRGEQWKNSRAELSPALTVQKVLNRIFARDKSTKFNEHDSDFDEIGKADVPDCQNHL